MASSPSWQAVSKDRKIEKYSDAADWSARGGSYNVRLQQCHRFHNLMGQRNGDYMQAFDNFRALMTDFSRVTGLSIEDLQDDALLFSAPDGSELSFFSTGRSRRASTVMVIAGLLPPGPTGHRRDPIRDNPGLRVACGATIGLNERGEAGLFSGRLSLEHLSGESLASMTQGLVDSR